MRSVLFFVPAIAWVIVSTILLTLPGSAFPQQNWLSTIWFDKWVHTGMFAVMTVLVCHGLFKRPIPAAKRKNYFILSGVLCLGYGILMEFVQRNYIPNRSFDAGDIIADGAGSLLGILFSMKAYIKK